MEDTKKYGIKCIKEEAASILKLIDRIDENFNKAVDIIFEAKGRVIVTGVGKSGHIGQKIASTLASTGTPSFFINPLDAYHGDLGMITQDDIVIAISYSGSTNELLRLIPLITKRNIAIISITGYSDSPLAVLSTCCLNVAVEKEACPLNLAPTSSAIATLAMGDAIACALIEVRGFNAKDFVKYHPGGRLGSVLKANEEKKL